MKPLLPALCLLTLGSADALAEKIVVGPGASIQTALAGAAAGDTVVVKGLHHENVTVSVPSITLRGAGGTIDGEYQGPCVRVTADDVTIETLTLVHGTSAVDVDADRVRLDGNTIRNAATRSIDVDGDDAVIRKNDLFDGGGVEVDASSASTTAFDKNRLENEALTELDGGAFLVRGNTFVDGHGVRVESTHDAVTTKVAGNDLERVVGFAIFVIAEGSSTARVESNDVDSVTGVGVRLSRDDDGDALVRKNRVAFTTDEGIEIDHDGAGTVEAVDNVVTAAGRYGVEICNEGTGDVELRGGKISGALLEGVAAEIDGDGDVVVRDVSVKDVGRDGVETYQNGGLGAFSILDCDVRDVGRTGISVADGGAATVAGNDIRRCAWRGVWAEVSDLQVTGNTIRQCGRAGIHVADHSGSGAVTDNDVRSCGADGVVLFDPNGFVITDNVCRKNRGDGIDLRAGAANEVRGNLCRDNLHEGIDNNATGTDLEKNDCRGNGTGLGPDIAGAGKGSGTVVSFTGNDFESGGATAPQRLDQ